MSKSLTRRIQNGSHHPSWGCLSQRGRSFQSLASTLFVIFSPSSLEGGTLWFGRIELQEVRIIITGWRWTGPMEETISLGNAIVVEKWTVQEGPDVRIHRKNRSPICGRIERGDHFRKQKLQEDDRVELKMRH